MAKTLKTAVRQELRKWQSTNPSRMKFELSWLKRLFLLCGRRPVIASLVTLVAYVGCLVFMAVYPPPYFPGPFDFGPAKPDKFEFGSTFGTLLSTQTAIAGTIYAIVFAFTTIFLGRQTATKASVQAYLVASGAKFSGISSLTTIFALLLSAPFFESLGGWSAFGWLTAAAVWVAFNCALTIYFLVRTFDFATPEGRRRARDNYALTIAWPREWQRNAARTFAAMPIKYELMKGDDVADSPTGELPAFSSGSLEIQPIVDGLRCDFRGKKQVANIRYGLLELAYASWRERALLLGEKSPKSKSFSRPGPIFVVKGHTDPTELEPGAFLVGTTGKPLLNWKEKTLSKWAFSFQPAGGFDNEVTVLDCLAEAFADIRSALDAGAVEEFEAKLKQLLELFDSLFEASVCINEVGQLDNQALSSSRADFFGAPAAYEWNRVLNDVLKAALPHIPIDPEYAELAIRTPKRLLSREREEFNLPLRQMYVRLQASFVKSAIEWGGAALSEHRTTLGVTTTDTSVIAVPEPIATRYGKVLLSAIGAWEAVKNESTIPYDADWFSWGTPSDDLTLLMQHLRLSAGLAATAVWVGDSISVKRTLGSLARWRSQLDWMLDRHNAYVEESWQLTVEAVKQPWSQIQASTLLGYGENENLQLEARNQAIANAWRDACVAFLATVANEASRLAGVAFDNASIVIRSMLLDSKDDESGSGGRERPHSGAQDFLQGYIRRSVIDGGYRTGYRNTLDGIVKECAPDEWGTRVAGRIYSVRAPDSLEDVRRGEAFLLTLLSKDGWAVDTTVLETAFQTWAPDDNKRLELKHELQQLLDLLKPSELDKHVNLWTGITNADHAALNAAITIAEAGVRSVLTSLDAVRNLALANAVIDAGACLALATSLSNVNPSTDKAFPLRKLNVQHLQTPSQDVKSSSITLTGYPKGRLTVPSLGIKPSNEAEMLCRHVFGRIRVDVVNEALRQLTPDERLAGTKESLLAAISDFVELVGATRPVSLLVPGYAEPSWLADFRRYGSADIGGESPGDRLVKVAGFGDDQNYLGHLRGAAVYAGLLLPGSMYLLPADTFQEIALGTVNEAYIRATAMPSGEDASLCSLKLEWDYKVKVKPGPAWALRYKTKQKRKKKGLSS